MNLLILSQLVGRQLLKTRIVQGLFLLNLVIAVLALCLGQLTFAEHERVTLDMGAAAIHFCSIFFCIFISGYYFSQDIEKQTYVPYLSRPVRRLEYLLAHFLSLFFFNFLVVLSQSLFLWGVLQIMGYKTPAIYPQVFYGQMLEVMILLSFVSFLSQWASLISLWVIGFSVYLIGHWMESIQYFIDKGKSEGFKIFLQFIKNTFFNLESLNWRSFLVYQDEFSKVSVLTSSIYAFLWTFFFIFLSYQCFRRKNLG